MKAPVQRPILANMKKWQTISKKTVFQSPWLTVRQDAIRTGKGIDIDDFYVIEYPTWVNIIAITSEGQFLIEQQYRHGLDKIMYELCAGACEKGEDPLAAAQRELLEETGFGGGRWTLVGKYAPNPNTMNNWCYTFLAEGVVKLQEPQLELTEEIEVILFSQNEVMRLLINGEIEEGIMTAPLWRYFYEIDNIKH